MNQRASLVLVIGSLSFTGCDDGPPAGASPVEFEERWSVPGKNAGSNLGSTLAIVGDVDRDGTVDFATTDYATEETETVLVRSGANGAVIHALERPGGDGDTFGSGLAGGHDLDADGVPDIVVSAFDDHDFAGHVWFFSGATGALFDELAGPVANSRFSRLAMLTDRNGDGVADLAVGADADGSSPGAVTIFSGATRTKLLDIPAPAAVTAPGIAFGTAIADLADLDGDGVTELAITAQFVGETVGAAFVIDGRTGAARATLTPPADVSPVGFGFAVAPIADLDGDARPDVLVGCAQCSPARREEAGWVGAYSSMTGALIRGFDGSAPGMTLGARVASPGDIDADGVPDVVSGEAANGVLGPEFDTPGVLRVFSGADGHELWRATGTTLNEAFAGGLLASDVDQDGVSDLLVGVPARGADRQGAVLLLRGVAGQPEFGRL